MKKFIIEKININSLVRSVVFTLGHFLIDLTVSYVITGAKIELIAISSILSPMINGFWYYFLDRFIFFRDQKRK